MARLLKLCGLSLLIYLAIFSTLADRPLSLGLLRLELLQKTSRLAVLPSPKLVILAGSNGPYSHSCVVLGAMLNMPCENAGIAVGIGLDDLFARYEPLLHPGDVVYMPMELQQYTASARAYQAAVDGEFLLRQDQAILVKLPLPRVLGAIFCCNLADLTEAMVEMPLAARKVIQPASVLSAEYDAQGDRVDNDLSKQNFALLTLTPRRPPPAQAIDTGYGTALIEAFAARESRKGVIIIGGMPAVYASTAPPANALSAIASIYTAHGGEFLRLPNLSQYPREDFFNGEDHLAKPCQYMHSIAVAQGLAMTLHRPLTPPPTAALSLAADCPSPD